MPILDEIKATVTTIDGKIGTGADTVLHGISGVGDFLSGGGAGSLIGKVKDAIKSVFGDADFITAIFKLIAEQLPKIIQTVDGPLTGVSADTSKAVGDLLKHVLDELQKDLLNNAGNLPQGLSAGPLQGLDALKQLKELLDALNRQQIELRIELVGNSLVAALTSVGGGNDVPVVKQLVSSLTDLLTKAVQQGGSPNLLLENLTKIVFPIDLAVSLLKDSIGGKKLWAWTNLPSGLPAGKLHELLNSAATFKYPADRAKLMLEREFRSRLVSAIDAYVKSLNQPTDARSPLADSDKRDAADVLCQIVTIVIDTAVQFIFEPECMPRLDIELPSFEAVGMRFSISFSRQFRIAIRSSISMLLRGFWAWTVSNHVLIELISTAISVAFSAMFEAVLRNLTWSLQIVSRYKCYFDENGNLIGDPLGGPPGSLPGAPPGSPGTDVLTVPTLDRAEFDFDAQSNPQHVQDVEYVVLDRFTGKSLAKHLIENRAILQGFVNDFAAYLDTAHSQFKVGSAFTAPATDEVTITRAQLEGNRLIIWATTSWRQPATNDFADPRPVLRAYVCCQSFVMKHGDTDDSTYEIDQPFSAMPRGCLEVLVVSNRGGRAVRNMVIV